MGAGLRRLTFVLIWLILAVLPAAPALAQWQMIEEVGANGQPTYTLRTPLDGDRLFQVWCSGNEQQLAILNYDGQNTTPDPSGEVVALTIQSDTGRAWQSSAHFYRHAPDWLGLRYRNSSDARAIVDDIIGAKASIAVVMRQTLSGQEYPYAASAKGSTAAGRAFAEKCFGVRAEPVLSLSAWQVKVTAGSEGNLVTLLGDLDQGGYFYAYCSPAQPLAVGFLSTNAATYPYEPDDIGLMLRVEIDGEIRSATGEPFTTPEGRSAILYAAPEYTESLLAAVGAARSEVAITIESYSNGMVTRWPAKNLNGLAQSVAEFNSACSGKPPAVAEAPTTVTQPEVRVPKPWQFTSQASPVGVTEHSIIAGTDDGRAALSFVCAADGNRYALLIAESPETLPVKGSTPAIMLRIGVGDREFRLNGTYETGASNTAVVFSISSIDVKEMLVRMANGEAVAGAAVTSDTTGEYRGMIGASGGKEAALQLAEVCLNDEEKLALDEGYDTSMPAGWNFMDGEAAFLRSRSTVIINAATDPAAGSVELNCYADQGGRGIAYYSDDFMWSDEIPFATELEMGVFVGDRFWNLTDASIASAAANYGIGSSDQAQIAEILSALAAAPKELTVSVRVNLGEWEPRKVPLDDASAVHRFIEGCPS